MDNPILFKSSYKRWRCSNIFDNNNESNSCIHKSNKIFMGGKMKKTLGYSLGYTCCIAYVFMVVLMIKYILE